MSDRLAPVPPKRNPPPPIRLHGRAGRPPFSCRLQALAAEADLLLTEGFEGDVPREILKEIHQVQRVAHEAAGNCRVIEAGRG